jgi:hypothetical protein
MPDPAPVTKATLLDASAILNSINAMTWKGFGNVCRSGPIPYKPQKADRLSVDDDGRAGGRDIRLQGLVENSL